MTCINWRNTHPVERGGEPRQPHWIEPARLFGERLTIEIPPGRHALRIHNTLVWKTAEFGAEPGEHVHFTVWNRGWGEAHYLLILFVGWSQLLVGLARGTPADVGPGG